MMKKLVFPKAFVRHPEKDFSDDGTRFRVYYYKDKLPLSVTNSERYGAFVSVRLDYLGIPFAVCRDDYKIADEFNGVSIVDMEKLIANCEYLVDKYLDNPMNVTPAVPRRTEADLDADIKRLADENGYEVLKNDVFGIIHGLKNKIVRIYCSKHDDNWDAWADTRIVNCKCEFKIREVSKIYGYEELDAYERYAKDILDAVEFVKKLNTLDTTYERVYVM